METVGYALPRPTPPFSAPMAAFIAWLCAEAAG